MTAVDIQAKYFNSPTDESVGDDLCSLGNVSHAFPQKLIRAVNFRKRQKSRYEVDGTFSK